MQETRRARLQAVIQQELSVFVPREVKDPRIPSITVTSVEVTPDAEQATVYISIFGGAYGQYNPPGEPDSQTDEKAEVAARKRMKDCLAGLTSAQGFMRKHLARVLTIRHIPTLIFKEDRGLENSTRVFDLLRKIETEPKLPAEPTVDDSDSGAGTAGNGGKSADGAAADSQRHDPSSTGGTG